MYYALTVNCFEGQSQNLHCSLLATPVAKIITFVLTGCSRSFPNMLAARESCANSSPSFFSPNFLLIAAPKISARDPRKPWDDPKNWHFGNYISGWWLSLPRKIWVRHLGWWHSQYDRKNNPNAPNHQPAYLFMSPCHSPIWLWVKIVYGTFRGVPHVWNEGASQLVLFRTFDMHVEAAHACCRSFSLLNCTTSLLYTCSTQVCLAWLVRALARTRPVASVTHRLPCEAVHSASDLSRTSHLLLWGRLCPRVARFLDCQLAAAKHIPTITQQSR